MATGRLNTIDNDGENVLDGALGDIRVGHGAERGTKIPGHAFIDVAPVPGAPYNFTFWDCPGFGDVGGPVSDIENAVAIAEVLKVS